MRIRVVEKKSLLPYLGCFENRGLLFCLVTTILWYNDDDKEEEDNEEDDDDNYA